MAAFTPANSRHRREVRGWLGTENYNSRHPNRAIVPCHAQRCALQRYFEQLVADLVPSSQHAKMAVGSYPNFASPPVRHTLPHLSSEARCRPVIVRCAYEAIQLFPLQLARTSLAFDGGRHHQNCRLKQGNWYRYKSAATDGFPPLHNTKFVTAISATADDTSGPELLEAMRGLGQMVKERRQKARPQR